MRWTDVIALSLVKRILMDLLLQRKKERKILSSVFQSVTTPSTKSPQLLLQTSMTCWPSAPPTGMHNNFRSENWLSHDERRVRKELFYSPEQNQYDISDLYLFCETHPSTKIDHVYEAKNYSQELLIYEKNSRPFFLKWSFSTWTKFKILYI